MAQAEPKTAQLRVRKNCIIAEGSEGQIFYASPTRARLLIDAGAAELVNFRLPVGPAVVKVPGPTETKPAVPLEKKSFPVEQDGRSTDSVSSIASGTVEQSSSSAAAPVLPETNAQPLKKRGRPPKSAR